MKPASAYECFYIPRYRVSQRQGDGWVCEEIPAHLVFLSVPWRRRRRRSR
jgi:hypothetical protein